jgi:plasmid stabilization system protein ParE
LKVIIRARACDDLAGIVQWIAADSPQNARSVAERIMAAIERRLAHFPSLGRKGRVDGTREWIVAGLPYIIVYQVDEVREAVVVLGVFHGAQQR